MTVADIQKRVRDLNYGATNKNNKPSLVNIEKHNLNQNATQLYCLIVNLPLILFDLQDKIEPFWRPIQTLLKCMQIIYSPSITEHDIKSLEKYIEQHLKAVIDTFQRNLTAKHHFLVHYPSCIRKMGPPIHLWTMRLESKHRVLTEIARKKMNFINLPKTLATEHQERISKRPKLSTEIKPSERSGYFLETLQFQKYELFLKRDINIDLTGIRVHKFASYDNIQYREGSLLIDNDRIYEIVNILSINSNVFFICDLYRVCTFNDFCNCIEIEKADSVIILNFDKLENKLVYDKMYVNGKFFIIADVLKIAKLI